MSVSHSAISQDNTAPVGPPIQDNEPGRLAYLHQCGILDTPEEDSFNRLTRLAAMLTGSPIAVISIIDEKRQWLKSRFGPTPGAGLAQSTTRDLAFCAYTILSDDVLVIPDARKDQRFAGNPAVTGPPGIRFYAGAPLIGHGKDGGEHRLGAFFVIDTIPREEFGEIERRVLMDFATIAVDLIESRRN